MANRVDLERAQHNVLSWNIYMIEEARKASRFCADLSAADLLHAFPGAGFELGVNLRQVNLHGARLLNLVNADLFRADLTDADLTSANLFGARLVSAHMEGADLAGASMGYTVLADLDLSGVRGLEQVSHTFPSFLGLDTLYRSGGRIPEQFLRGCGVPDDLIAYLPSLVGAEQAVRFYSCFISYSTKDDAFAKRLHGRLREEHVRVWFAPEDMKGGELIRTQIDQAIELHDRLLLVLSPASISSNWVMTEVRRVRRQEEREHRRKLFPITLVPFEELRTWERIDSDTGEDTAASIREYFIPDFSGWKQHDAFELAFERLLRDLRAAEHDPNAGRRT